MPSSFRGVACPAVRGTAPAVERALGFSRRVLAFSTGVLALTGSRVSHWGTEFPAAVSVLPLPGPLVFPRPTPQGAESTMNWRWADVAYPWTVTLSAWSQACHIFFSFDCFCSQLPSCIEPPVFSISFAMPGLGSSGALSLKAGWWASLCMW